MRILSHIVVVAGLLIVPPARAADGTRSPMLAIPGDTVTHYGATVVKDPYRSLEDGASETTRAWLDDQARHARRVLDSLPHRRAVRDEYAAIDAQQPPTLTGVKLTRDGTVLYVERALGAATGRLQVRPANGIGRALRSTDGPDDGAVSGFAVSDDGRRVAVLSTSTPRSTTLQLHDVATGAAIGTATTGVWSGGTPVFARDGDSLIYTAIVDDPGAPRVNGASRQQLRERRIDGTERTLMGWNAGFGPTVDERDLVSARRSSDGEWLFASIRRGASGAQRLLFARADALRRDPATATWTTLFDTDAAVRTVTIRGKTVFVTTSADAARYRIARYDTDRPTAPPVEVVAEQSGVIEGLAAASDGLYYTVRTGYESALYRAGYAGRDAVRSPLPFAGAVAIVDADSDRPGVVASVEGWTRRKQYVRVVGRHATDLHLITATSRIGGDWVVENVPCETATPVQAPMVVIHRKGLVRDGSHPLVINGYGAYGFLEAPYFFPKLESWIGRGGVFVDITPRGGGGTGEASHRAAMGTNKPNTWRDVIACAETLVARGYTTPARMGLQGTEMGGLMAGRAATERPDLFAAVVIRHGITDPLRYLETPTHAAVDERELGDPTTEDGVRALLAESTYHHIDDARYPAVLLTTGLKEQRIAPWMAFKTAARFAAAATDRPVLLRVDEDGALGAPITMAQRNDEAADRLAFLLWTLGAGGAR